MGIVDLPASSALCLVPWLMVMVGVAYFATKARLKARERMLRDIQQGRYDVRQDSRYMKGMRVFIVVSSTMALLMICAIAGAVAYDLFPSLLSVSSLRRIQQAAPIAVTGISLLTVALAVWIVIFLRRGK